MADESDEENRKPFVHQNQPYDESLEVPDAEEVASLYTPTPRVPPRPAERGRGRGVSPSAMSDNSDDELVTGARPQPMERGVPPPGKLPSAQGLGDSQTDMAPKGASQMYGDEDDDDGSETTDDDDDDEGSGEAVEGAYDPADYEHLAVSSDIKELFQYITRYTPQSIELDYKLKPFIPDFIPSVGDIDAFIKVNPPDNKAESLGLTVLDEPCAKQSDPTVLDLHLRAVNRQHTVKAVNVKSISNAEKTPKAIDNWIESISELHRTKPAPNVHYTKNMPDIDTLMQEWPPEFEELLKEVNLPTADIDCDLSTYVDMICAILDIPVYKSRIQSLHVLFTLFSEFKNSQHFRSLAQDNKMDNAMKGGYGEESDTLVL